MTTNQLGTNAYFHVFRYYEKVNIDNIKSENNDMLKRLGGRRIKEQNRVRVHEKIDRSKRVS
jgi:hypothetical protein